MTNAQLTTVNHIEEEYERSIDVLALWTDGSLTVGFMGDDPEGDESDPIQFRINTVGAEQEIDRDGFPLAA